MASQAFEKWSSPNGLMMIRCWARDGLTIQLIASRMGITEPTFLDWRKSNPAFDEAMSEGKEVVDYQVENALLKSALGFKRRTVKIVTGMMPNAAGNRVVKKEVTEEEIAPNVTACLAWLNNRKPDQWKRNRDNVLELNDEDSKITVNIVRHSDGEKPKANDSKETDENWSVEEDTVKKESCSEEEWPDEDDGSDWPEE